LSARGAFRNENEQHTNYTHNRVHIRRQNDDKKEKINVKTSRQISVKDIILENDKVKTHTISKLLKWAKTEGRVIVNTWINEANEKNKTNIMTTNLTIKNVIKIWKENDENTNDNKKFIVKSDNPEEVIRLFSKAQLKLAINLMAKEEKRDLTPKKVRTHISVWTVRK
jgi:hypothetical protein